MNALNAVATGGNRSPRRVCAGSAALRSASSMDRRVYRTPPFSPSFLSSFLDSHWMAPPREP